jgi:transcription initiation factor IIE alpha subunit
MFKPNRNDIRIALEIRVNFLRNRIIHLNSHKQVIVKRDNRIVHKENPVNRWKDYMSNIDTDCIVRKLKIKLEQARKELKKINLNDN